MAIANQMVPQMSLNKLEESYTKAKNDLSGKGTGREEELSIGVGWR